MAELLDSPRWMNGRFPVEIACRFVDGRHGFFRALGNVAALTAHPDSVGEASRLQIETRVYSPDVEAPAHTVRRDYPGAGGLGALAALDLLHELVAELPDVPAGAVS